MKVIDKRLLQSQAKPSDTRAVRVVLRRVNNLSIFRLHAKNNQYIFEYHHELQAHVLDVPESLWMDGIQSKGPYRDNLSIAHDLQGNRGPTQAPLLFLLVPWADGEAVERVTVAETPSLDFITPLRKLLLKLNAPTAAMEAIDLAQRGNLESLQIFVDGIEVDSDPPNEIDDDRPEMGATEDPDRSESKVATDAATRMREMRARRKAEKAKLQPA